MNWLERNFGGSLRIGRLTIFGFNAMHITVQFWTQRWGYVCFHPTVKMFGCWWPWYFYVSPNATPWAATFAIGPGVSKENKLAAPIRRALFGHRFNTDEWREELQAIREIVDRMLFWPHRKELEKRLKI
jgi:hypothetical protein